VDLGAKKMSAAMLTLAATGAQVGSGLLSGYSAFQNGQMQAKLAEREGELAMQRARAEQDITMTEGQRALGEARAAAGASGFDLSGSASDIFGQLAAETSAAARMSMYEGDLAQQNSLIEAKQLRKNAQNQLISSVTGAIGQAIAGVSSANAESAAAAKSKMDNASTAAGQFDAWRAQYSAVEKPSFFAPIGAKARSFGGRLKNSLSLTRWRKNGG
jgi:hypothetical protein